MKNVKSRRSFIYNTVIYEDVRPAPLYRFIHKFMNAQWNPNGEKKNVVGREVYVGVLLQDL